MVTIVGVKQVETKDGKQFTALVIQGELRFVKSETTGNYYLSANKMRISTHLSVEFCQSLIGQKLPGTVERIECEPYPYENQETGELMTLTHTYVYSPQEQTVGVPAVNPFAASQQYQGQQQFHYPQQQSQNQIPFDLMSNIGMVAEA